MIEASGTVTLEQEIETLKLYLGIERMRVEERLRTEFNIEPDAALRMIDLNIVTSGSAWLLAVFQVPFIINLFISQFVGKKVNSDNPWDATTLEWATPTPPPHGNFLSEPVAYRGPYEYSVPGEASDFCPQFEDDPSKISAKSEAGKEGDKPAV